MTVTRCLNNSFIFCAFSCLSGSVDLEMHLTEITDNSENSTSWILLIAEKEIKGEVTGGNISISLWNTSQLETSNWLPWYSRCTVSRRWKLDLHARLVGTVNEKLKSHSSPVYSLIFLPVLNNQYVKRD